AASWRGVWLRRGRGRHVREGRANEDRGATDLVDGDRLAALGVGRRLVGLRDPVIEHRADRHELLFPCGAHVLARVSRKELVEQRADPKTIALALEHLDLVLELPDARFELSGRGHRHPPIRGPEPRSRSAAYSPRTLLLAPGLRQGRAATRGCAATSRPAKRARHRCAGGSPAPST